MMVLMLWLCPLSAVLWMMVRLLLLPALSIPRIKRWRVRLRSGGMHNACGRESGIG